MIILRHRRWRNAARRRTFVRSLRRIDSPCRIGGATYYPLTDVQGTVWGYADADNSIVARFEYDAWGNILSATSSIPALARNRYRFQCREWSAATGLVNFRARWYDPVTGRWLSKDPIGLSGGLNLYVFCGNDPVNGSDPYGLTGMVFFLRPTPLLLDGSPKVLPRISPSLKGWRPGRPVPPDFRPPPNPKGNWYNPFTKESLHNDMNHPRPESPHWDYIDSAKQHFRWYPDGRIEPKPHRSFPDWHIPNEEPTPKHNKCGDSRLPI